MKKKKEMMQPTRKSMSKRERHLRMLEKLGLRSMSMMMIMMMQPTRKSMSKRERHLRMLEKLGFRSIFFFVNTKTQRMFPEIKYIIKYKNKKILNIHLFLREDENTQNVSWNETLKSRKFKSSFSVIFL